MYSQQLQINDLCFSFVCLCTQIGEQNNGSGCADWLQNLRSPVEATIGVRLVLLLLLRRYCQFRPEGRWFAAALLLLHPFMNINALQLSISSGYWCHRGYSYSTFSCAGTSKCPFLSNITIYEYILTFLKEDGLISVSNPLCVGYVEPSQSKPESHINCTKFFFNKLKEKQMHKVRDCTPKLNLLNFANFYSKTYWPNFNFVFPFMKTLENDFEMHCEKYWLLTL